MTRARYNELCKWADKSKWPNWEMVMYVNNISLQEAMDFYARLYPPSDVAEHVRRGIEAFSGGEIRGEFVNHSFQYVLTVPTKYKSKRMRQPLTEVSNE